MNLNQDTVKILEDLQKNIISWYPFKQGGTALEIEAENGKITKELCKYMSKVVATNLLEKEELKKYENLEVITTDDLFKNSEKFDYIIILGLAEKARQIFKEERQAVKKLISCLKAKLKPDGVLLIGANNKLGINRLCSEKKIERRCLSRNSLEKILDEEGLVNRKFYYPMPNYKQANVIFTDKCLPNLDTINRDLILYSENTIIALNEVERIKIILEENPELFKQLANSFFIECSNTKLEENNITFISFSNIRKPEYRIKTIIQGDKVYKYNDSRMSEEHLKRIKENIDILRSSNLKTIDTYETDRIVSKYQKNTNALNDIIYNKFKEGHNQEAFKIMERFFETLRQNLEEMRDGENCFKNNNIEYSEQDIENLHFVRYGLWDLIFQNCFYIEDEFYFYDQEWKEDNIPIEFIFYRAIKYFKGLEKFISKEEIYEKMKLESKQLKLFEELDEILQKTTRSEEVWNLHLFEHRENSIYKLQNLQEEKERILKESQELLLQKDGRIKVLEEGIEEAIKIINEKDQTISEQGQIINYMTNSVSWKVTKPLRGVRRAFKKGNKLEEK